MKYRTASILLQRIEEFKKNLKSIDIEKADQKRKGHYKIALEQLEAILDNRMELEELLDVDNILRNIMVLALLDKTDATTKK